MVAIGGRHALMPHPQLDGLGVCAPVQEQCGVAVAEGVEVNPSHRLGRVYPVRRLGQPAGHVTIEDKGTCYEVAVISLSDEEQEAQDLTGERMDLLDKLEALDYIGVKIATGRATASDYADEITLMTEYAGRINEIDERLSELGEAGSTE